MVSLWTRWLALYSDQWEKQYGNVGSEQFQLWSHALEKYSDHQIRRGLQAVIDEGSEFVPNLIKFMRLCRQVEPYSTHDKNPALPRPKPRYSCRRIEMLKMQFLFDMPIDIPRLKSEHMVRDWTAADEAILLDAMAQFTPESSLDEVNRVIDYIEFSGGTQKENAHAF